MSVYIFGVLNSGYTQYPNDSTSKTLKNIYSNSKAATQIAIHRDGNLMYYCYIRKLDYGKYIGLAYVLTESYLTKIDSLFSVFENMIEIMANKGAIVHYSETGEIVTSLNKLYDSGEDVAFISGKLILDFNSLSNHTHSLPPIDFSVAKDSVISFDVDDLNSEIVKASYTFSYTFIYKNEDYNTVQINNYKGVLYRINKENIDLRKKCQELIEENAKISRQKQQFRKVILLSLIVIGCGIGIYFLNNNLNNTQEQLVKAHRTIKQNNDSIAILSDSISGIHNELHKEYTQRIAIERKLSEINRSNPFVVTGCNVNSTDFTFDYYADKKKDIIVTLKAVNEKTSEVVSNTHSITVYKGTGTMKLNFYYTLNTTSYYYVVLMYDGRIIAGKRW